jgi:hypothetical protein
LNPELTDAQRILDAFKKLDSKLRKVLKKEGVDRATYIVKPDLLPLEYQIALKKASEATATTGLNMKKYRGVREWTGSLLATCDPRATDIRVTVGAQSKSARYIIYHSCKSHMDADELVLVITIDRHRDEFEFEHGIGFILPAFKA